MAIVAETLNMRSRSFRAVCRRLVSLTHRIVRSVGRLTESRNSADVSHATLVAHWRTMRGLLLEQRLLRQFDAVEQELRNLVAMQVGGVAYDASICDLYLYANSFMLWEVETAERWVRALRFRGEILRNEHCRPTEAALIALGEQLQTLLRDLDDRARAWPDRAEELSSIDVRTANQARLKSA